MTTNTKRLLLGGMVGGPLFVVVGLAACFVLARYYRICGQAGRARASRVVGAVFIACLMGSAAPGGSLTLFIGVTAAMLWMALVARQLIAGPPTPERSRPLIDVAPRAVKQLT